MVVFPWEKDYIVSGRPNRLPFRSYVEAVWKHAASVVKEAREVWIIGYSFDPMDCGHMIGLLRQAENCKHIFIQNLPGECERITRLLRNRYGITTPIELDPSPF
jgi:hypothetical protein